jgi:hypothetical protein
VCCQLLAELSGQYSGKISPLRKKEWPPSRVIFYFFDAFGRQLKKLFIKRGQIFFLATEFYGHSRKELVTLAGGQINGGKSFL